MSAIYTLTLRQLAGRVRLLVMGSLALLPPLFTWIVVRTEGDAAGSGFETAVLGGMLNGSIVPLVALAIAATAFGHELEDRTLANLTVSPIPRWQIALPKLLASGTIVVPLVAASALATAWIAYEGDPRAALAVTLSAALAAALYSAAFVWLGLVTTQAIGVGLLYIVLWEGFFSGFVSGARMLSIRHYSLSFMHGLDERRFAGLDTIGFGATVVISAVVLAGFLLLTVRRLRRMDVP